MLVFLDFLLDFFAKTLKILTFFSMTCLCMSRSMSDNFKNQILKIIIVENFAKNQKFVTFVISFVKDKSMTILVVFIVL